MRIKGEFRYDDDDDDDEGKEDHFKKKGRIHND